MTENDLIELIRIIKGKRMVPMEDCYYGVIYLLNRAMKMEMKAEKLKELFGEEVHLNTMCVGCLCYLDICLSNSEEKEIFLGRTKLSKISLRELFQFVNKMLKSSLHVEVEGMLGRVKRYIEEL